MLSILRLIRLPNLLIIALSMILIRYCLILPAFKATFFITNEFPSHLSDFQFALLVISTILIAAAGYIINDYFDVSIDAVNKPGKNIIGKKLNEKSARTYYYILSGIGIALGFILAIQIAKPVMGLLHLFTAVSLWMYSSHFKRRLLAGNFIISLLCALSLMVVGLFEPEFYANFVFILWYAIPAFLLTFVRELIKDIEDMEGDKKSNCKTAPIVFGVGITKAIIIVLLLALSAYITLILYKNFFVNKVIGFTYLESLFIIPILGLIYLAVSAGEKRDYHYASVYTKILMLGGVLSLLPFWYYFLK